MRIEDKVARLRDPDVYPDRPAAVDVIETHFSWVFLTEQRVYKLKKPVRYHGLDFTTLAARRHNCAQEVTLNRRLAPTVYLGVSALTLTDTDRVEFDGPGTVLDWLVVMRRLPAQAMLDAAIRADAVDLAAVDRIAALLAAFYRENAAPAPLAPEAYRQRLAATLAENRAVLSAADGLDQPLVAALSDWQEEFLQSRSALLDERAGRLVDAHGDLRPEHICLSGTGVRTAGRSRRRPAHPGSVPDGYRQPMPDGIDRFLWRLPRLRARQDRHLAPGRLRTRRARTLAAARAGLSRAGRGPHLGTDDFRPCIGLARVRGACPVHASPQRPLPCRPDKPKAHPAIGRRRRCAIRAPATPPPNHLRACGARSRRAAAQRKPPLPWRAPGCPPGAAAAPSR